MNESNIDFLDKVEKSHQLVELHRIRIKGKSRRYFQKLLDTYCPEGFEKFDPLGEA